jgi:hypothetical protein
MVMNVAVLLVGGRPACFADLETNAFHSSRRQDFQRNRRP